MNTIIPGSRAPAGGNFTTSSFTSARGTADDSVVTMTSIDPTVRAVLLSSHYIYASVAPVALPRAQIPSEGPRRLDIRV